MKKILLVALLVAMCVTLCACSFLFSDFDSYSSSGESIELEMIDVTNMVLSKAKDKLKSMGFKYVYDRAVNDFIIIDDNWIVTQQSVEAGKKVSNRTEITLTCIKLDNFAKDKFSNIMLKEAQEYAQSIDLEIRCYYDSSTKLDITSTVKGLQGRDFDYYLVDTGAEYGWSGAVELYLTALPKPYDFQANGHYLKTVRATVATCKADGNIEYYQCIDCNAIFANKTCKNEIEQSDTILKGDHSWQSATCSSPEKCRTCGLTRGSALEHNWSPATCTKPQTCKLCGTTNGSPLGHQWKDATCTSPQTCSVCGMTSGTKLGHQGVGECSVCHLNYFDSIVDFIVANGANLGGSFGYSYKPLPTVQLALVYSTETKSITSTMMFSLDSNTGESTFNYITFDACTSVYYVENSTYMISGYTEIKIESTYFLDVKTRGISLLSTNVPYTTQQEETLRDIASLHLDLMEAVLYDKLSIHVSML